MAAFSIIKNRNSGKDYQKQDSTPSLGSQGLSFVLQNPSTHVHQNSCCTSHGSTAICRTESLMDSKELVSAYNMPLGDKTLPIMDGEKEILCSDELKKEMNESYNRILNKEEILLPLPIKMINNDSSETLQQKENVEINREDEPTDNLPMQSVKDEEQQQGENDDDDGTEECVSDEGNDSEDVTEKEEESSEGTGCSFMESNVEAVWPTEMIESLSQELEEINASNLNSGEKKIAKPESHDYINGKSDGSMFNNYGNNNEIEYLATLNEKITSELGMQKVENVNLPKRKVFVWSVVVVILLLLLLHIHRTISVYDFSYQKSVVGPQV